MKQFLLPALLTLGACTVGPNYAGPPASASGPTGRGAFARAADPAFAAAPGLARWWEGLGDPLLNRLVDDALAHSPTIDQATARIREAEAQLRQQRTAQLPSVSANATYVRAELPGVDLGASGERPPGGSTDLTFYNLGLNASWELDLFGGGRRRVEQARATADSRRAELSDAQVSLSAQVAQAYVQLRDLQDRIRLNRTSTILQEQQLGLSKQRAARGTASRLDIERLRAELDSTEAQAIPLRAQADEARGQLAILTGRRPGALDETLATPAPVPLPPASVAIGDPAALIANRPDIRAAERELAAGTAAIGVNKAKELPGIRFLGLLGLGGRSPGDVFDLGNLTTLAAPSLSWPLLDFGRARAATRVSVAQRDRLEAAYRRTVLEALQEAESTLSRFANTRAQLGKLALAEEGANRAAALNRQRLGAGTTSLVDQLDVERQRLRATIAVAQARAQLTSSFIAVNKALGLGWSDPG